MSRYRYRAMAKIIRVIESCANLGQLDGMAFKMMNNYADSRPTDDWDYHDYLYPIYSSKLKELKNESI